VRQWEINDIIDIKKDKKNKNISFTFGGSKGGTIEFHANKNIITEIHQKSEDCRASLEIPAVIVNNSSIRSSIASPTLSTSSRPSSTHKSIESEEPQYEEDEQYEEQDNKLNSRQDIPEEEEEEEEEEEIELPSPKFGVALYDFDAQGDDEVSIREGDELWVIDDVSSEEWWKVKKDDEEGVVPASFIEVCIISLFIEVILDCNYLLIYNLKISYAA
jgi:actin cytoskeleton-regulatory complex protein SLA1